MAERHILPERLSVIGREDHERVGRDLDAVVVSAASLQALECEPAHVIALPLDRFVPAPGQGAVLGPVAGLPAGAPPPMPPSMPPPPGAGLAIGKTGTVSASTPVKRASCSAARAA